MIVIGVTGGMASGKSTIARMLAGRGILHVDADKLVHRLMNSDHGTIRLLSEAFPRARTNSGRIDRAILADAVSQNKNALEKLEAILHPRVRAAEADAIIHAHRRRARAIVLDIPLLFETDAHELCDVVIVAHAPKSLRRRRAFARRGMTEEKWKRLLDRQLPDQERLRYADHVIHTSVGKGATQRAVKKLMKEWGLI